MRYTLNPMPQILNKLFSFNIIKIIILIIIGILMTHPINIEKLIKITISSNNNYSNV